MKLLYSFITGMLLCAYSLKTFAQQDITLGNYLKKDKGNSNTSIVSGEGIGTKMSTGKKSVRLQTLQMELKGEHPDSIKCYVRIFPLQGKELGENLVPDSVYTVDLSRDEIRIDLSPLDLMLKGDYVVGLQWAETREGINNKISFPTSTFKKGFYYRDEGRWKKLPFFGIGMVVHGTTID